MAPESTPSHTHVLTERGSKFFIGNWNSFTRVQFLPVLNLNIEFPLPKVA